MCLCGLFTSVLNYNLIWEDHARTSAKVHVWGVFSVARLFGAFRQIKIWWVVKVQIGQIARIGGPSLPATCRSGKPRLPLWASILLRLLLSCLFLFGRESVVHKPLKTWTPPPPQLAFSSFRSELKLSTTTTNCACFFLFVSQFLNQRSKRVLNVKQF